MNDWLTATADFKFLLDSGLLFEINRQILNPFGLALVLKRLPDGKLVLADQLKDCREKPDDAFLDPAAFESGKSKLQDFLREFGWGQMEKRRDVLGYSTQDFSSQGVRRPK